MAKIPGDESVKSTSDYVYQTSDGIANTSHEFKLSNVEFGTVSNTASANEIMKVTREMLEEIDNLYISMTYWKFAFYGTWCGIGLFVLFAVVKNGILR